MVELHLTGAALERGLVHPAGGGRVRHVEDGELGAGRHPFLGGVLPDAQEQTVADGVQVGRVAGDLQLPDDRRVGRVGQVDDVQRVGSPEGDDVADVAHEPHGEDRLPLAQPAGPPQLDELVPLSGKGDDLALGRVTGPRGPGGGGDAQDAVVLGHRELVEQPARDLA